MASACALLCLLAHALAEQKAAEPAPDRLQKPDIVVTPRRLGPAAGSAAGSAGFPLIRASALDEAAQLQALDELGTAEHVLLNTIVLLDAELRRDSARNETNSAAQPLHCLAVLLLPALLLVV